MFTVLFLFSICLGQFPFKDANLPIEDRINDLLGRLTLEEKVNQMMDKTPAIERLGILAYDWWSEALHGVAYEGQATVFPQCVAMAATFDDTAVYEAFNFVGDEARAKFNDNQRRGDYGGMHGISFWAPNVNIFRDPRWGRGQETYGEDPFLSGRMGVSAVKGLQGNDSHYIKAHSGIKHFAVHSGPEPLRHKIDVHPTPRDLYTTYLPAFEAAVRETNVGEVMCAYNAINGKPACESDLLFSNLRDKWGYKGFVVTDCDAINDFWIPDLHHVYDDQAHASVAAVRAGTDLECGGNFKSLIDATHNGLIKEEELDIPLRRLIRARIQLGMFDDADLVPFNSYPTSIIETEEHLNKALELARKGVVLLKNGARGDTRTLPLQKNIRRISVIGPNANLESMLLGNYNGSPGRGTAVTILNGIKAVLPNVEVNYAKGCDHVNGSTYKDDDGTERNVDLAATARSAANSDAIVFVAGITPSLEGEQSGTHLEGFDGGDRTTIELPTIQRNLLAAIRQASPNTPIVLVVCAGSAIALTDVQEQVDAVLYAWYPGVKGGQAVAEILVGDVNPSGRLPVTLYKSDDQLPSFTDYNMSRRTYRYLDVEPLYQFGYGLSYTSFAYADAAVSKTTFGVNETVTLTLEVQNTGSVDGDDVVQVYIRYPDHPLEPIKALKGFKRVSVPAHGSRKVEIPLPPKAFETFDDATETMATRPGNYVVSYGSSSRNTDLKVITVVIA